MKTLMAATLLLIVNVSSAFSQDDATDTGRLTRRWVYLHPGFDLRKDEQAEQMLALVERAGKAGYNGMSVPTGRLKLLDWKQPESYYRNIERVRVAAEEAGLELIPRVMSFNGYANGTLSNNPNLAAALPVRDCVLEVRDGKAAVAMPENLIPLGGMEEFSRPDYPDGWTFVDAAGSVTFADSEVKHSGESAVRFQDFETATKHGNCRMMKKLTVKPFHQYHISFWMKTQDVKNPANILVMVHGDVESRQRRNLQKRKFGARSTQDWTQHHAVFNTLNNTEVWLYIGGWNAGGGIIWLDDISLREVAGVNLLRRDGCPVRVTSEDGSQVFAEGRDFERWEYAQMGRVRWPGQYEVVHPEPPLVLTEDSRIQDGQKLRVSYYHAQHHMNMGMAMCIAHDEGFEYQTRHLELVKKYFQPKTYISVNDEIRLAGWCEVCRAHGDDVGDVVAYNARRCFETIRRIDPAAEVLMWSDMFDPHHNAVDNYWLTRGTMKGSWEGLNKDVMISNWNQRHSKESLKFFAARGHHQIIAGYYDRWNWQQVTKNWHQAAQDVPHIDGIMYTTWSNKYDDLEEFIRLVSELEAADGGDKATGRSKSVKAEH